MTNTRVTRIVKDDDDGRVLGVECQTKSSTSADGRDEKIGTSVQLLRSDHVVLATGGFASDRSRGSYLDRYRPELAKMPATAGAFSTGDGIGLAAALGAGLRDMEKIQIHPTGFVDPSDRTNPNKVLAAELLRGVGGILLDRRGRRFCDELGTRDYVVDRMLAAESARYAETKEWDPDAEVPTFHLILSAAAAGEGDRHVALYTHKGLVKRLEGIDALAVHTGTARDELVATFASYRDSAHRGRDEFGKTVFRNVPAPSSADDPAKEVFYVGEVTPVLHYCMGGVAIDTEGSVLDESGDVIPGLYAAGEVAGGVHGNNRLGGNSLLECAVFGTIVGQRIPIRVGEGELRPLPQTSSGKHGHDSDELPESLPILSAVALAEHNTPSDCWLAVHGVVYNLTSFLPIHPGKAQPIVGFAGKDATSIFDAVHSTNMLKRMKKYAVGLWTSESNNAAVPSSAAKSPIVRHVVSTEELRMHNTPEDCYVAIHGTVYDLSEFAVVHPGGAYLITKFAGRDATETFQGFHPIDKLKLVEGSAVGPLGSENLELAAGEEAQRSR